MFEEGELGKPLPKSEAKELMAGVVEEWVTSQETGEDPPSAVSESTLSQATFCVERGETDKAEKEEKAASSGPDVDAEAKTSEAGTEADPQRGSSQKQIGECGKNGESSSPSKRQRIELVAAMPAEGK